MNILIVGAGAAGRAAAHTFRAEGAALVSILVIDDRLDVVDAARDRSRPMTPKRVVDHGDLGVEVYVRDGSGWTHRLTVDLLFWCSSTRALSEQLGRHVDDSAGSDRAGSRIVVVDYDDDFTAVAEASELVTSSLGVAS